MTGGMNGMNMEGVNERGSGGGVIGRRACRGGLRVRGKRKGENG